MVETKAPQGPGPVPRAHLSGRAQAALWVLRITVLLLVLMVGYTFIAALWP